MISVYLRVIAHKYTHTRHGMANVAEGRNDENEPASAKTFIIILLKYVRSSIILHVHYIYIIAIIIIIH